MKVGIFGGSFNPPHLGHMQSILNVQKKLGLQKVIVVPAAKNPLKTQIEGPTPAQRLEMVKLAVKTLTTDSGGVDWVVDDSEVQRAGASFTIDTIHEFKKKSPKDEFFLIIGADQLETFHKWKKFKEILSEVHLVVTSRPGFELPTSQDELPETIGSLVLDFDFNYAELSTGHSIQFVTLPDVPVSSTEVRKWLRTGKTVQKYLPLNVENYIRENKLYSRAATRVPDFETFTKFCGIQLADKKAVSVRSFDLRKMSAPSEFAIITSGTSTKHASSLGDNLVRSVKEEYGLYPLSIEGQEEGRWVVVDYGSLIVHIFYDFVRQEYSLESLWTKAIEMPLA